MKYLFQLLLRYGSIAALSLLLAPPLQAQQSSPRTSRTDILQMELRRQSEREMLERALAEPPKSASRGPSIALAEFKADFLGIQVANNNLMKAVSRGAGLDLNFVGKSAGEIRKLARRLKTNLALPKTAATGALPKEPTELGLEELRPSLSTLDRLVFEFVSNPVFESAKVIDTELSTKARHDLDQIIELSAELKKSSEKLRQATAKTH
jgi:hypothetical protein